MTRNLLIALVLFSSCVIYDKCKSKYGLETISKYEILDTIINHITVPVSGDSLSRVVFFDTVQVFDTVILEGKNKRALTKIIKKESGRLRIISECKTDTIYLTDTIFYKKEIPVTRTEFKEDENWMYMIAVAFIFLFFVLLLKIIK